MFYKADDIQSLFVCDVCENKMKDPRVLPCGKSLCHECIFFWTDKETKTVKCQHCDKKHKFEEDFPRNLTLQQLIQCDHRQVFQSKHVV